MSITIATQSRRFTVKIDEIRSEELFDRIVMDLIQERDNDGENQDDGDQEEPVEVDSLAYDMMKPLYKASKAIVEAFKPPVTVEPKTEQEYQQECLEELTLFGYKGFLHVRCEKCGKIQSFCSKEVISSHRCKSCGHVTSLDYLKRLYVNCQCGRTSRYKTNLDGDAFEISCFQCGAPVDIRYNDKKDLYETVGWRDGR